MEYKFSSDNFDAEVLKSDLPVLVDFYADWCGPCQMMGPVVAELASDFEGKLKVGKVNVDEDQELAQKYGVMSIPYIALFKDGSVVDSSLGAVEKDSLVKKINKLV